MTEVDELRRLVRDLAGHLAIFVAEHSDPGSDALGSLWLARQVAPPEHPVDLKVRDEAMTTLLRSVVGQAVKEELAKLRTEGEDISWGSWGPREAFVHALDCALDDLPEMVTQAVLTALTKETT